MIKHMHPLLLQLLHTLCGTFELGRWLYPIRLSTEWTQERDILKFDSCDDPGLLTTHKCFGCCMNHMTVYNVTFGVKD